MQTHPDQFSTFYTANNIALDVRLINIGYKYFAAHFNGKTCLELGPATGYMTRMLVNDFEKVHAVEGSKNLLDQVPDYPNLVKTHSLFENYTPPFLFDTIIMNHVLEHIEHPVALLKRIKEWLAPNGVLILGVPNAKSLHRLAAVKMGLLETEYQLNARDKELGHYRIYDLPALENDAKEAGYSIKAEGGTYLKFLSNAQMENVVDDKILQAYHELGKSFVFNSAEIFLILTRDEAPRGSGETQCSLIIPVYKNEGTIVALLKVIENLNTRLNKSLEAVFVVDGSPDASYQLLKENLPKAAFSSQLICLSRNFGSLAAVRMGLSAANGPYFGIMAADLQEPPELIEQFFGALRDEPYDVVIGTRSSRNDPGFTKLSANLFWGIYSRFIQPEMPRGGMDVFGCNREVRDALLRLNETHSSLAGLLLWLGFRRKVIFYPRQERLNGKSAWTMKKKLRYMLDSIFSFTDVPVVALLFIGMTGFGTALLLSALVLIAWLLGWINVPGYTPVMLSIMASTSLTLGALGIIGSYVWRTFENTKQRPLFVPMSREAFKVEKQA